MIELNKIKHHDGTQSREKINEQTVNQYVEHLESGGSFPAIKLFYDGIDYWIADGWHRYLAHHRLGMLKIHKEVMTGTRRDAIKYSLSANSKHGLPRSNADKRKALVTAHADDEWCKLSTRDMALLCDVSNMLVSKYREELSKPKLENTNIGVNIYIPKEEISNIGVNIYTEPETVSNHNVGIEPTEEPEYTELDAAHDKIIELQTLVAMKFAPEEMAITTSDILSDLRNTIFSLEKEVKVKEESLRYEINAKHALQAEIVQLKKQVAMLKNGK